METEGRETGRHNIDYCTINGEFQFSRHCWDAAAGAIGWADSGTLGRSHYPTVRFSWAQVRLGCD